MASASLRIVVSNGSSPPALAWSNLVLLHLTAGLGDVDFLVDEGRDAGAGTETAGRVELRVRDMPSRSSGISSSVNGWTVLEPSIETVPSTFTASELPVLPLLVLPELVEPELVDPELLELLSSSPPQAISAMAAAARNKMTARRRLNVGRPRPMACIGLILLPFYIDYRISLGGPV